MSDVTLRIDGRPVTVPAGTTILKAARELGIDIPTFCYHDGLSIAANCRMCLVETNKSPKLVPACHAQVMPDMDVQTQSERVRAARRGILEFILIHHPVDCPICDQSGECELQNNYRDFSLASSRLNVPKLHKPKAEPFGPYVIYDGERCILCTRCIRFVQEVSRSNDLAVLHRGDKAVIAPFPGRPLDNPYSMCTADVCPVGALTTVPFRFRARVWWLQTTPAVCNACARNCAIHIDTRRNEVQRYRPRPNPLVNDFWMCDAGRLSFERLRQGRLAHAFVRRGHAAEPATTRQGADAAVARLQQVRAAGRPIGVLLSLHATNEDAHAALRFAREALRTEHIYVAGLPDGVEDDILIRADKNPNRTGIAHMLAPRTLGPSVAADLDRLCADVLAARLGGLVVFGSEWAVPGNLLSALAALDAFVVMASHAGPLTEHAHVALPSTVFFEQAGSFTNFRGQVQRFEPAVRPPNHVHPLWKYAERLASGLGAGLGLKDAAGCFADLAARVPAFAGLTWDALGEHGARLSEPPAAPPQTDDVARASRA